MNLTCVQDDKHGLMHIIKRDVVSKMEFEGPGWLSKSYLYFEQECQTCHTSVTFSLPIEIHSVKKNGE